MTATVTSPETASPVSAAPGPREPRRENRGLTFFSDTWLIFTRQMRLSLRNPAWVIIGLIQPILYLAFFGPLLSRIAKTGALGVPADNPYSFFVPGLLIQLGLFGAAFVGFAIISDWRAGVIERFRVTPVSRMALLAGRVLRDVVTLTVQAIVLVLAGLRLACAPRSAACSSASASWLWSRSACPPCPTRPACCSRAKTPSRRCSIWSWCR